MVGCTLQMFGFTTLLCVLWMGCGGQALPVDSPSEPQCPHRKEFSTTGFSSKEDPHWCDLNEDEYGRPYYGPIDEYNGPGHYTLSQLNTRHFNRPSRQTWTLDQCITSDECKEQPTGCFGTGTQNDWCGRRCTCNNGILINCCRVRKEWRSMSEVDRCSYIQAVYHASTVEPWKSCYDELIKIHSDNFRTTIHEQVHFLPWHRWYLLSLENLLRKVDCTITVPYWDWSLEPTTWSNSIVWADNCGMGGNGDPDNNDYVSTGSFREDNWVLPSGGGPLQRAFNGNVPDSAAVALIQRDGVDEFDTWHSAIQVNLHNAVHCRIYGTMCSLQAANDPVFFLHHGFIDKLWSDWQNYDPEHLELEYYSTNSNSMPATTYSPSQVFKLANQPGCVHVCIQQPTVPRHIVVSHINAPQVASFNVRGEPGYEAITPVCSNDFHYEGYSPLKLAGLVATPFPTVPESAHKLFNTSQRVRLITDRISELFNDFDMLQELLENNGYHRDALTIYHPVGRELHFSYAIPPQPYTEVPPTGCQPSDSSDHRKHKGSA